MADKMMRIAGRAIDGLAKPIKVDPNGNLGTIYSGGLSATKGAERVGALAGGDNIQVFLEVKREAIIHNLQFFFDREDPNVRVYLDFWDGNTLADGSHFREYIYVTSPTTIGSAIRPGLLSNNNLFLENDKVIYLQQPLHVKGFRIRLRNSLSTPVNLACNVLWSEV